jgi:hypothetical protein
LVIEAAMIANRFPAGMYRKDFAFMHWQDFEPGLWSEVTAEALEQQLEFEFPIIGSDISGKNLAAAKANVHSARLHKDIRLHVSQFSALQPPQGKHGIIMINPPYGERIRLNDISALYKSIGDTLKREFTGYQAWVISSDRTALKLIGLRPGNKFTVFNGQLECRLVQFDLYSGSKKDSFSNSTRQESDNQYFDKKYQTPVRNGFRNFSGSNDHQTEGNRKNDRWKSDTAEKKPEKQRDDYPDSRKKSGSERDNPDRRYSTKREKSDYDSKFPRDNDEKPEPPSWLELKAKKQPESEKLTDEGELPEAASGSKWKGFLEERDYVVERKKELRSRKPKKQKTDKKPPVNYDDLED